MIGNVQSKTKIQASKINNIIDNVNANSRNLQSLMHPTMTPFPDARKLAPEMYFHVMRTAITEDTGDGYSTETGALLYVGGNISEARNMCMIEDRRVDDVIILRNGEFQTLDELKASLTVPNQYGGYIPIFDYGKNGSNTIMAALFQKNLPPNTSSYAATGYILAIFCTTGAFITEESIPVKIYNEEYRCLLNTIRVIYSENVFGHTVLSGLSNSASDVGPTLTRTLQNQCHLGVLYYNFPAPMFLDARYNEEQYCWEVYVGYDIKCVAFNNCAIEYAPNGGWVKIYMESTEPIWGMITGASVTGRELMLGRESDLFDAAPPPPTGDAYIPQLGPFPIAEYKNHKVTQIFHGAPVNNFLLPDASLEIDGMFTNTGTDFQNFKSLEVSPMKNLSRNDKGNYINLYNFHSKDQDNEHCVGDQSNWFDVGIYDSEESTTLSGNSYGKTMLIRSEGSTAKLQYNVPTLDIKFVKDALSGYIEELARVVFVNLSSVITGGIDLGCDDVRDCVSGWIDEKLSALSGNYWEQGGEYGTNYGGSIGNSKKQEIIDLDSVTIKTPETYGTITLSTNGGSVKTDSQIECNGIIVNNQDCVINNGVVFMQSSWPTLFVLNGNTMGLKPIVDGNGETQLVIAKL